MIGCLFGEIGSQRRANRDDGPDSGLGWIRNEFVRIGIPIVRTMSQNRRVAARGVALAPRTAFDSSRSIRHCEALVQRGQITSDAFRKLAASQETAGDRRVDRWPAARTRLRVKDAHRCLILLANELARTELPLSDLSNSGKAKASRLTVGKFQGGRDPRTKPGTQVSSPHCSALCGVRQSRGTLSVHLTIESRPSLRKPCSMSKSQFRCFSGTDQKAWGHALAASGTG